VADIADIDSWLRHVGLGRADARRVREKYGDDAARKVRENPYRLADEVSGIGFLTADSLRRMLGIAPTSPFRLYAALRYVLTVVARTEGHVYLSLAELIDQAARQLDERRATTGRWEPAPKLVEALREYAPRFARSRDAWAPPEADGDLDDETPVYGRDLHEAEQYVAERLAGLVLADEPLFKPTELEPAMQRAEARRGIELEPDQRRAVATALTRQLSIISGGPGTGKTTTTQVLVDLLRAARRALLAALADGQGGQASCGGDGPRSAHHPSTAVRPSARAQPCRGERTAGRRAVPAGFDGDRRRGVDGRPAAHGLAAALDRADHQTGTGRR
jgi:exodeoxyribonuclease V alpha subunit